MDAQKVMLSWNNFVWDVMEGNESPEERKIQMAKAAMAWMMYLHRADEPADYDPDYARLTADFALSLTEQLEPLLQAFQECIGAWFNEHQFRAASRMIRDQGETEDSA